MFACHRSGVPQRVSTRPALSRAIRRHLGARAARLALSAVAVACLAAGSVAASMLDTGPEPFAVFSGGHLSTGNGVSIDGSVGAHSIWLGNNTVVTGSGYSGGALDSGEGVAVGTDIYGLGDVYLSNNTTITGSATAGGNLGLGERAAIGGNATTAGSLSMNNRSTVGGDAWYGSSYWLGKKASITGSLSELNAPVQAWTPGDLPSVNGPDPGEGVEWYASDVQATIDPGSFGSLSTGSSADLSLGSGTYSFESIWLDHHSTLTVNTNNGDAVIHVSQNFSTGHHVNISVVGDGTLTVYVGGSIWLDNHNDAEANFISLGSTVGLGEGTSVEGVLWAAGDVSLGNQSQIVAPAGMAFMESGGGAGASIPEPATLVLTLLGMVVMSHRRGVMAR